VLEQPIDRLRQRVFRPLDGLLLRSSAGDAAGKIGKPRAERSLWAAFQNRRIKAVFSFGLFVALCYFTHPSVLNHTPR